MPQLEGKRELAGAPERRMPRYARGRMTYDLILREAERIILEDGPAKLNIRTIAKGAKVSPATIYEYFADGAEICDRLLWRSLGEILDDLERYVALEKKVTVPRVFALPDRGGFSVAPERQNEAEHKDLFHLLTSFRKCSSANRLQVLVPTTGTRELGYFSDRLPRGPALRLSATLIASAVSPKFD